MNKSIIDSLFYGGICAISRRVEPDPQRTCINRKIEEEQRYFISKMSADDCQRFEALNNLYSQANTLEERDCFGYGLKLGVMLMCEIFVQGGGPEI